MDKTRDFNVLLADEEFQQRIAHFESYTSQENQEFIKQYSITKEEFVKARAIISGLMFKEIKFSENELDYLYSRLQINSTTRILKPSFSRQRIISLFSKVAALLFIPLLIVSVLFMQRTRELRLFKTEKLGQLAGLYNTVSAPIGGQTKAVLPDGSEVLLNSGSSIQYPVLDNEEFREVKLSGEGFFKIKRDPKRPLFVDVPGMKVKVYGTTFNVRAYKEDPVVETVLVEGKVSIVPDNKSAREAKSTEYHIRPGERSSFSKQDSKLVISKVSNMDVYTGWVNGKYVFKNMQFKDILSRLEQLYNVEFVLEDNGLGNSSFDATFENQSIDQIMEIFSISLPIKWQTIKNVQNEQLFTTRRIVIKRDSSKES